MLASSAFLSMSQDLNFCTGWHCKLEACSQDAAYGWMGISLLLAFLVLRILIVPHTALPYWSSSCTGCDIRILCT